MTDETSIVAATLAAALLERGMDAKAAVSMYYAVRDALEAERKGRERRHSESRGQKPRPE
jgi:hypothetical protein